VGKREERNARDVFLKFETTKREGGASGDEMFMAVTNRASRATRGDAEKITGALKIIVLCFEIFKDEEKNETGEEKVTERRKFEFSRETFESVNEAGPENRTFLFKLEDAKKEDDVIVRPPITSEEPLRICKEEVEENVQSLMTSESDGEDEAREVEMLTDDDKNVVFVRVSRRA